MHFFLDTYVSYLISFSLERTGGSNQFGARVSKACVSRDKVNPIHAIFSLSDISIRGKDLCFKDKSTIESNPALISPIPVALITNASKTKMLVRTADTISAETISSKSANATLFAFAIEEQDIRRNESIVDIAVTALRRYFNQLSLVPLAFDEREAFGIYTPFDLVSASHFAICFPVVLPDEEFIQLAFELTTSYKETPFEVSNVSMLKAWADLAFSKICAVRAARISQIPLLSDTQMEKIWEHIKHEYQTNLEKSGVKLTLGDCASTQNSSWLICFTYFEGQFVAKDVAGEFARLHDSSLHKDQQPRHLKGKNGFYLTTRYETIGKEKTPNGYHMLVTLKEPHPSFLAATEKRAVTLSEKEFDEIKKKYNYECATCHIHEGDVHPKWGEVVKLQQGHRDPSKALSKDNCIPQCQHCNQTTMDRFVWNANGGVDKVNNGFWLENHMTESCEEHMRAYFLHKFEEEGLISANGN